MKKQKKQYETRFAHFAFDYSSDVMRVDPWLTRVAVTTLDGELFIRRVTPLALLDVSEFADKRVFTQREADEILFERLRRNQHRTPPKERVEKFDAFYREQAKKTLISYFWFFIAAFVFVQILIYIVKLF